LIVLSKAFVESMVMNPERWHGGTGYDLGLLETATKEGLARIEPLLLSRGVQDWRDVEALSPRSTRRGRSRDCERRSQYRVST